MAKGQDRGVFFGEVYALLSEEVGEEPLAGPRGASNLRKRVCQAAVSEVVPI